MYDKNVLSFGHVPIVVNASISARKNELWKSEVYNPYLRN